MVNGMSQTRIIRWSMGIGLAMSVSLCWSLSHAGTISDGGSTIRPATSNSLTASVSPTTEAALRPMLSAIVPVENGLVLRTIPTLSKPISVGGRTLVPYSGQALVAAMRRNLIVRSILRHLRPPLLPIRRMLDRKACSDKTSPQTKSSWAFGFHSNLIHLGHTARLLNRMRPEGSHVVAERNGGIL